VQTREWLCAQAARLVGQRRLLEAELSKFAPVATVRERYTRHYAQAEERVFEFHDPINPKYSSRGQMSLRRLIEEACASAVVVLSCTTLCADIARLCAHSDGCLTLVFAQNWIPGARAVAVFALSWCGRAHSGQASTLPRVLIQIEELRIRLAQFRRALPQYCGRPVPKHGIHLTGLFHTPHEWSPAPAPEPPGTPEEHPTPLKLHALQKMSPQGYLEWLKGVPLAQSAAHAALPHMLPAGHPASAAATGEREGAAGTSRALGRKVVLVEENVEEAPVIDPDEAARVPGAQQGGTD
jgi:hypothetical protein